MTMEWYPPGKCVYILVYLEYVQQIIVYEVISLIYIEQQSSYTYGKQRYTN